MNRQQMIADLARVRRAVRALPIAVSAESAAFDAALLDRAPDDVLHALHEHHLTKVNAVQSLVVAMDLLERRHPFVTRALDAHRGRDDDAAVVPGSARRR